MESSNPLSSKSSSIKRGSPKSLPSIVNWCRCELVQPIAVWMCSWSLSSVQSVTWIRRQIGGLVSRSVILNWYRSSDFVGRRLRVFGDIQSKTSACSSSKNLTSLAWIAIRRLSWTLGAYTAASPVSSLSLCSSFQVTPTIWVPSPACSILLFRFRFNLGELEQGFPL